MAGSICGVNELCTGCLMLLDLQNKVAAPETQAEESVVNDVQQKIKRSEVQGNDPLSAIVV